MTDRREEWVLVPKKPTLEMSRAVREETRFCDPVGIYQKMIAAAPTHPAITHCDNCGCDWLDNGLNPIGCPYCKQPAGVMPDGISDDVIKAVWRAAMTSAHNVCVNRSNRWNDDDGPDDRITEANECAKEIAHWLEADEGFIAEIRAILAAQQQGGRTDG